jgi:hypothetical protein
VNVVPGQKAAPSRCVISLEEYVRACRRNKTPGAIVEFENQSEFAHAVVCAMGLVGALEPLSAIRPDACNIKDVYDKTITVPPAVLNPDGSITPTDGKLMHVCAPMGKSLVVDKVRVTPANLTAEESGEVAYKRVSMFGFSEGFCPAGEPGDGDGLGTFQTYEHVILCPESGFDVHARNNDPFSSAKFHIHAEMWAAC